jgi:hypothetical protein
MKYLMIHCLDESSWLNPDGSEQEDPAFDQAIDAWVTEMETTGVKVSGGRLRPVGDATTVRVRNGEVLLSDGPFAETKEQIAGFDVIECASLDEAIEVAARHPTAKVGTFELRPFWPQA